MKNRIQQLTPSLIIILLIASAFAYMMCASVQDEYNITSHTLEEAGRIKIGDLTPSETKRLDILLNQEVSPCGNEYSLGQTLLNPQLCPLANHGVDYILMLLKQDYNVDEISAKYMNRYASIKGLDIPIDGSPIFGPDNPTVTVVVFADFECPYCAKTAEVVEKTAKAYPEKVAVVFKHFPLAEIHPTAELGARAGYAAHQQGKFWQMHDTMFSVEGAGLDPDKIRIMAIGIGLDVTRFEEDLVSDGATAAIEADKRLGQKLGVKGTPQLFVNGRLLEGGANSLSDRIKEEFLRDAYSQ